MPRPAQIHGLCIRVDQCKDSSRTVGRGNSCSATLQKIDPDTKAEDLGRPGHIFPLIAKDGGVLRRAGHTEAAIDLPVMAGFEPAGVICEIIKEDGEMARLPELLQIAKELDLKIISIKDLIEYRLTAETLIH